MLPRERRRKRMERSMNKKEGVVESGESTIQKINARTVDRGAMNPSKINRRRRGQ